jgi:hypothetical protein
MILKISIFCAILVILLFYIFVNKTYITLDKDIEINYFKIKNDDFLDNLKTCKNTIYIDKLLPEHIILDIYDKKGWGLKTTKAIKKGDIIYEYPIEKNSNEKIKIISNIGEKYINPDIHFCEITKFYNLFSYWDVFINHDGNPNAYYEPKVIIKNKQLLGRLYALKDISKNEELLIDYNKIKKFDWFFQSLIDLLTR